MNLDPVIASEAWRSMGCHVAFAPRSDDCLAFASHCDDRLACAPHSDDRLAYAYRSDDHVACASAVTATGHL